MTGQPPRRDADPGTEKIRRRSFAPSSFERWSRCPGSVPLLTGVPRGPDSQAALNGKKTHLLAEKVLTGKSLSEENLSFLRKFRKFERVLDHYVSFANRLHRELGGTRVVEKQIPLKYSGSRAFIDLLLLPDDRSSVYLYDLKTGVRPIRAEDSAQLRIYGSEFISAGDGKEHPAVERIHLGIIQPQARDTSITMTPDELRSWREEVLLPAYERARDATERDLRPGEIQCRYCDAKPVCPAYRDWQKERYSGGGDLLL